MVESVSSRQSGRAASDDSHFFAVAFGRDRFDITFAKRNFGYRGFVFADGDRFVAAQFQYAAFLAEGGANATGELRKVACLLQHVKGLSIFAFVEEVLPFGLFVANRASPVAEGYAAVHAARSLRTAVAAVDRLFYFREVAYPFVYGPITCLLSMYGKKCFWISHCCNSF